MIILNNKTDVLQYAKAGNFVIYGAGQFGITLLRFVAANGLISNVQCFIISQAVKKDEEIMGVPIFSVEDLEASSRVLIAVHSGLHNEITNTLKEHKITDIFGFSKDCYLQMRRTIPDFFTEQFLEQKRSNAKRIIRHLEEIMYLPEIIETNTAAFGEYKNAFIGKDVVLLGNGPSLNRYKPIEGAIHIGVNRAYKFEKIKLDYLFVMDFGNESSICCGHGGLDSFIEDLKKLDCKKFIGQRLPITVNEYYEDEVYSQNLPEKYYTGTDFVKYYYGCRESLIIHKDITKHSMLDLGSIIFTAAKFALFAHPRKIYIVGCDGYKKYENNYFIEDKAQIFREHFDNANYMQKKSWKRIKKFAEVNYPDVEIISVNPVAHKGLFKEIEM